MWLFFGLNMIIIKNENFKYCFLLYDYEVIYGSEIEVLDIWFSELDY